MIIQGIRANPHFVGGVTAIVIYLVLYFLRRLFKGQVTKIINRSNHRLDDLLIYSLAHTTHLFMFVTAAYVGFQFMPEYRTYPTWSWRIFFITLMFQIGVWGSYFIRKWMQLSFSRRRSRDPASAGSIQILELMLKVSFLIIILMFTLHNLGIEVTAVVAGLGVGGIAIALAMQNILGDLFSSLSIILDKPFVVGDFIIVGEWLGEVESIGLKTTRIRSLGGEQIIMSNSDLLGSRIRNMKRLHERRNNFFISLPHQTPQETIKRAVEILTAVTCSKEKVRFERCHYFRVTPTALDIELVYFVLHDDFNFHMDIQQSILLDVHHLFLQEKIAYAIPVQKLDLPHVPSLWNSPPDRNQSQSLT